MTALALDRSREWRRVRRVAFFVWAATLALVFGIGFVALTILSVGTWLANANPYTTPVTDLRLFGLFAYGDRFAEMAALAIAIVALGLLAARKTDGWRITAWSAGAATVIVGAASIVWTDLPGTLGQAAGAVAVAWGVLFVAVAAWEERGTSRAYQRAPGVAITHGR